MSTTFTELEYPSNALRDEDDSTASKETQRPSSSFELVAGESQFFPGEETPAEPDTVDPNGTHVSGSITPFLTRHIPKQYNPLGERSQSLQADKSNTKFCYRHHPDLKCRRQANEPSMDQMQKELAALPAPDQAGISHVWSLFSAAPSRYRNLMLQGILAQCCFPQLSFISASVRDLIKIDFLSVLPAEIGLRILTFLDPTSICKAAQVSRRWRQLADDDVVWHKMCEQHIDRKCTKCGWGLPMLDRKRLRTEKRQIQLRAEGLHELDLEAAETSGLHHHSHHEDDSDAPNTASVAGRKRAAEENASVAARDVKRQRTPESGAPRLQAWKDVYKDRFRIGTNWKYGRCSVKTFKGHTNGVMCVQFDDNIIASGSYDSTIKIWDIESGKEIRTLRGHTLGIRCLQFDDTKLASGSLDGTIKFWDLESGRQLCNLTGHTAGVTSLHFDGATVASGSMDHTIRVWNFKDRSASVLRGHTEWVNCVKIDAASRTLLSCSDDCTIRLWDLDTMRCIKVFHGHAAQVQQVVPMPIGFDLDPAVDPSAAADSTDLVTWTYDDPNDADRPPPPRYMVTGALSGNIRLWDIHSGRCLRTFFGHIEGVWGLAADTLRVVSGANDGMIKIWDPRAGTCERTFTGHAGPVTCVGLNDRRMLSGSEDHEVRLYSFCN